mgnify:FL=1
MKKILALLLAVVMVLGMVACASKTETPAETTTTEPAATETTEETKTEEPAAEETTEEPAEETGAVIQKVALVTDVGTIDDESFNQATWQGVKAYCEANGIEYTYYQPTEDSTEARCISIDQAIKEGANVVVMPGYLFGASIVREQEKYPDVYFIAVDVGAGDLTEDYATYYDPAANVVCATFAEEQAGYLAGYAVVMDGYTKLGFLGGMAVPAVIRYGYGWLQGARDAAKELGVEVECNYTYAGQFNPDASITAKMEGWYTNGTEIVFACGGGIYASAVEAANIHGAKVVGVDVDQSYIDACIVTSAMKGLQNVTETILGALEAGEWDATYGGKFITYSLAEGDYVGIPTAESSWRFNNFTMEQYEAVHAKLMSGEIVVDNSSDDATKPTVSEFTNVTYIQ